MIVYISNLLAVYLVYGWLRLCGFTKGKSQRITMFIIGIFFILISGLRAISVGIDTIHYYDIFNWCTFEEYSDIFNVYIEKGYFLLNKVVYSIFRDFQLLLIICSLWIYVSIIIFIKHTSCDSIMSLILFITMGYYASSLNIMRQFIGLGFVLYAYYFYIWKREWKPTIVALIIGFFFHESVIIVFPILIIFAIINSPRIEGTFYLKAFAFIVGLALIFGIDYFMQLLVLSGIKTMDNLTEPGSSSGMISILMKVGFVVLYLLNKKRITNKEKRFKMDFLCYSMIVSCIVSVASFNYPLVGRFNLYFSFLLIIFIPEVIEQSSKNSVEAFFTKLALSGMFILMFLIDLPKNGCVPWLMFN